MEVYGVREATPCQSWRLKYSIDYQGGVRFIKASLSTVSQITETVQWQPWEKIAGGGLKGWVGPLRFYNSERGEHLVEARAVVDKDRSSTGGWDKWKDGPSYSSMSQTTWLLRYGVVQAVKLTRPGGRDKSRWPLLKRLRNAKRTSQRLGCKGSCVLRLRSRWDPGAAGSISSDRLRAQIPGMG
jgi:hypothetical protein